MFQLAILIGGYSYLIFFLGILHLLYRPLILAFNALLLLLLILLLKKHWRVKTSFITKETFFICLLVLLEIGINLIGALGPELAFDALWYHLTLPKYYLEHHAVLHIPGGLLYYSDMPKLGEMIYIGALAVSNEVLVKIIHLSFGILCLVPIYKLSRRYLNNFYSLLAILVFYSNLVVAWESTTAYIDLIRTFFEIIALWSFMIFIEKNNRKFLIYTAVFVGLSMTTKLLSIGSAIIFFILLVIYRKDIKSIGTFCLSFIIPLPWIIFSYINTGNPVYPFFTKTYAVHGSLQLFNPLFFLQEVWKIFLYADDPISPIYLISIPLVIIFYKKFSKPLQVICLYSFYAIIAWYLTPRTGGGRFILPYLPAFSIIIAAIVSTLKIKWLKKLLIVLIYFITIISIFYRSLANKRYIPVIIGSQSKQEFLTNNLNFTFGDFYDSDGFLSKKITKKDTALLFCVHNLYYVDFPFIHESWRKKTDTFTYVLTQNCDRPQEFNNWNKIYENKKTGVKLYSRY